MHILWLFSWYFWKGIVMVESKRGEEMVKGKQIKN